MGTRQFCAGMLPTDTMAPSDEDDPSGGCKLNGECALCCANAAGTHKLKITCGLSYTFVAICIVIHIVPVRPCVITQPNTHVFFVYKVYTTPSPRLYQLYFILVVDYVKSVN